MYVLFFATIIRFGASHKGFQLKYHLVRFFIYKNYGITYIILNMIKKKIAKDKIMPLKFSNLCNFEHFLY